MQKHLIASLLALAFAFPACGFAAHSNDTEAQRWNLTDLYANRAAWNADAKKLETQLVQLQKCSGHLGDKISSFKSCLDLNADILKRYARLATYASQFRDQDTGDNEGQDIAQNADIIGSKLEEASSFFRPEILKLGQKKIDAYLNQDKSLAAYRFGLHDILRGAQHTLDKKGEELIASFGMAMNAPAAVYSTLSNAEMPWPKVTLSDGQQVTIDQAAYTKYRASPNRADRKLVFDAFWGKWKEFERSYGVTFYEQLKRDAVYAKVRNYPDSLTHALDGNNIPRAVYDTLVDQTRANLPTLHRYFKLRAKMLGVQDLRYFDIYPQLVSGNFTYSIDDGVKLMLSSVKPLGDDYVNAITKASTARWMDVYPRPRKRSGAYMSGVAYDVHPYILLNYNDDYESVSTLTHEWGHAMHSYLANKHQPFSTADYPIFTAEIASTTNEVLLLDHMLKIAKSDDERLLYLGSALENLRGTFFR